LAAAAPLASWLAVMELLAMLAAVTAPVANCALVIVPARMELPLIGPVTWPAVIAYGVVVSGWRGLNVANAPPPFVRRPISSHRLAPVKMPTKAP